MRALWSVAFAAMVAASPAALAVGEKELAGDTASAGDVLTNGMGRHLQRFSPLDKINKERHEHIITIEDPIEYLHNHHSCLVNQREIHSDTHSFTNALRSALREDPDVVLIGEMRDLETIEAALRIAETGHLTFATLHTNSCVQTINRVLDVFPPYQQPQVRAQLSMVLEGVLSQTLIPKASGSGRTLAIEVMVPNMAELTIAAWAGPPRMVRVQRKASLISVLPPADLPNSAPRMI